MVEQEWMKFVSTGSVQDYLSYRSHQGSEGFYGDATLTMAADKEHTSGSVSRDGAVHSSDGHGIVSNPSGVI